MTQARVLPLGLLADNMCINVTKALIPINTQMYQKEIVKLKKKRK